MHYLYLIIAISAEVVATSALKATGEFSRFWPSTIVVISYLISFYFLTLTLRAIPIGITYAIWAGLGIVLVSIIALVVYKQKLDFPAVLGIGLIVAGVIVINLFSKSIEH